MWKWLKERFSRKPAPSFPMREHAVDERALELVALGNKMFTAEDYRGAMDAYESALRVDGHCSEAWYRRGRILMRENKILEAAACYVRCLELDPKMADAWCGLGEAVLEFIEADKEPLFIRENRLELISETYHYFERSLKLGRDIPSARVGRDRCRAMTEQEMFRLAKPPHFSFHSGGILELAKREVVAPFLKPGDYRRKEPLPVQND